MKKLHRIMVMTAAMSLVVGLALAAVSEAQPGPRGHKTQDGDGPGFAPRGLARLELTDEQKDKLNEMRRERRQEAMVRRGEMQSLRAQLQAEFLNEDLDEGKVRSLSKKMSELRSRADEARIEHRLALRDLLTDEQREQLQEMRLNRPGRGMRGGPGFHHGRGGRCACDGPGFHRGSGRRGGRGACDGPGFHRGSGRRGGRGFDRGRGPRGEGPGFPGGAGGDCPWGGDGPRGRFFGDAEPEGGFGLWWLDPGADPDGGLEALPAPEQDETTN